MDEFVVDFGEELADEISLIVFRIHNLMLPMLSRDEPDYAALAKQVERAINLLNF